METKRLIERNRRESTIYFEGGDLAECVCNVVQGALPNHAGGPHSCRLGMTSKVPQVGKTFLFQFEWRALGGRR